MPPTVHADDSCMYVPAQERIIRLICRFFVTIFSLPALIMLIFLINLTQFFSPGPRAFLPDAVH
jgi:hypothetical protein